MAWRPRQMGDLPLLYPSLSALEVCQTVNELVPTKADIDLLLTLNRLLAPQPLYYVQDWPAETVLPQVLGIAPEQVYDNWPGRALDRLHIRFARPEPAEHRFRPIPVGDCKMVTPIVNGQNATGSGIGLLLSEPELTVESGLSVGHLNPEAPRSGARSRVTCL